METASDIALEIFNLEIELRNNTNMHFILLASKRERLRYLYSRLKKLQSDALKEDAEWWSKIKEIEINEYDNIKSGESKKLCEYKESERTQQKNNRRPKLRSK
jgi:hypothetical protein